MPLPAPVAAPAPAPAPLPAADPYMGMTQADLREIGAALPPAPPMTVEPAPAPVPVTPPPLPPQPVPPPPTPPTLEPEFSLPEEILNRLPPEERFESPPIIAQPNVPPAPVPTATPAPAPSVGIETLAPDDFTMPAGIAAGPMSTPSVNTRAEAVEAGIPMPDGSQFNPSFTDFSGMEFDSEGIPMVDPVIIQNALAEAGIETPATGGASTFTPNLDAGLTLGDTLLTEPTPTVSSFQPEAGGFTLTPEQQAAIDAAIGSGSFSLIDDSYGFTDGQQDAAGVIPGAGAAANATTNASTNPNAGQDWYENMTPEQQAAYDAFIQGGGFTSIGGGTIDLGAIGGGTVNIPGLGGYTGTTPRPVVEAIQNLTPNRDPTLAGNVSAATQYGLTGAPPVQAPSTNPFQRPETQQGIGSLAGGG